ncbi:uncharacterized protein LOC135226803 [Macrobrachium nipponense]|uniref:uncharacterized protein LOC135226803 n=1 Tax=Macrobrachium nipponense TaxID=159736 RepID=UPI0030C7D55A
MAPRVLAEVGSIVAKEVIQRVAEHKFKGHGKGRRLGGSRRSQRNLEGLKRAISFGLDKVEEAGGVKNLIGTGVARAKREGFMQVAKEVVNFASQGLVKLISPSGFNVTFKPDGSCLFLKGDPSSSNGRFISSEGKSPVVVVKEELSDTGDLQYCEIVPVSVKLEPKE